MNRMGAATLALVVALGLGACRDGSAEPTVTPLTTAPSSASASPTPTRSVATPDEAALLAEAEGVYRAYVAETLKLEAAGGAEKLPAVFDQYLLEPYKGVVEATYQNMRKNGSKVESTGRVAILAVEAIDASTREGAVIALSACLDGSQATVRHRDGTTEKGSIVLRELYFKRDGRDLKIFSSRAKEVPSC
ncbi:hypothetical protein [Aestuariimicrobium ganziense]|uniref:hypothetical protein n=1 Tax=Aestuariimicrobium ganziense TaxID=2773677 RepID=UPI0019435BAB|nr:hypothetical protein [Aestuariimicrobium ganziense]